MSVYYPNGHLYNDIGSLALADNGTHVLEAGVASMVYVWTTDYYLVVHVSAVGVVRLIMGTENTAIADTDGCLCVYNSGTGAVIKNALGSAQTVKYSHLY